MECLISNFFLLTFYKTQGSNLLRWKEEFSWKLLTKYLHFNVCTILKLNKMLSSWCVHVSFYFIYFKDFIIHLQQLKNFLKSLKSKNFFHTTATIGNNYEYTWNVNSHIPGQDNWNTLILYIYVHVHDYSFSINLHVHVYQCLW